MNNLRDAVLDHCSLRASLFVPRTTVHLTDRLVVPYARLSKVTNPTDLTGTSSSLHPLHSHKIHDEGRE